MDFTGLELRLKEETYPQTFRFKFVGKNTSLFETGTRDLEGLFPELVMENLRYSKNESYASYTYCLEVSCADEVLAVYKAIQRLSDLEVIL